jgi:hypothetical protein
MKRRLPILPLLISLYHVQTFAQSIGARTLSGALVTGKNEAVAGATITARSSSGEERRRRQLHSDCPARGRDARRRGQESSDGRKDYCARRAVRESADRGRVTDIPKIPISIA